MAIDPIRPIRRWTGAFRLPVPLPAAALVLAALAAPAAARIQEGPAGDSAAVVSLDRLRFEYKCYFSVPEWKGKGEEAFLKKLEDQKAAYKSKKTAELPALEGLMAEAYWKQKEECVAKGDEDGADAMSGMILGLESKEDPVVKGYRKKALAFGVARQFDKAKKMEAAGDDAGARKAFAIVAKVGADDPAMSQQSVSSIVRIVSKQRSFQAVMESNDLADIGSMLDAVLADLKSDLGDGFDAFLKGTGGNAVNADLKGIVDEKTRNAGSTQDLAVAWRDVSAALKDVKGTIDDVSNATFRLEPEAGAEGKPFPSKGVSDVFKKNPFKWHRGTYTVKAFAPKAERPFATFHGIVLGDAPGAVELPNRVPAGMVWCPPLKAGGDALFVDRNEVTVGDVEAVAGSDEALLESVKESRGMDAAVNERYPAWFFRDTAVLAYEKASGKKVPTDEQWLQAAFGGRDSQAFPFPWGKDAPDGTRAYLAGGRIYPDSVGGRAAGASPCGAEDMAGNVAEWVRKDGKLWLLGGDYLKTDGKLAVFNKKIPLRDPMPGKAAYDSMSGSQQNEYIQYKFDQENEGYLVGLRTVVPVPSK